MKKILLIVTLAICSASFSFADNSHPCKNLEVACKNAGFYKGGTSTGKGLYKNCIEPLTNGQSIKGVTVEQTDIQACKEKITQMQK